MGSWLSAALQGRRKWGLNVWQRKHFFSRFYVSVYSISHFVDVVLAQIQQSLWTVVASSSLDGMGSYFSNFLLLLTSHMVLICRL